MKNDEWITIGITWKVKINKTKYYFNGHYFPRWARSELFPVWRLWIKIKEYFFHPIINVD